MNWSADEIRGRLLVICGGIAFFCALQRLDAVVHALRWGLGIIAPFLFGGILAFILNVPMRSIERHLFTKRREMDRVRRPLALVLTLVAVAGVFTLATRVIAPGIREAAQSIGAQFPEAMDHFQEWLDSLERYLPLLQEFTADISIDWQSISTKIMALLRDWSSELLSTGGGLIGDVVSGVSTFTIGLVFSFYILVQKDKLTLQTRQITYAIFPLKTADKILEISRLTNRIFSGFLSGQCLEACILGSLFVVVMTLFRMPYAVLVGVLVAITALIPIIGAFIGCGVGAVLIAMHDPLQALVFIILFLALQQIESNLIYPHVVGSSVGLPSIWVLAAVTLGGKLMGIPGILFFIPLCSVIYTLFREFVYRRLREQKIPKARWMTDCPPNKHKP